VKLPGASELFRPTGPETATGRRSEVAAGRAADDTDQPRTPSSGSPSSGSPSEPLSAQSARSERSAAADSAVAGGSGRVRHEEKITVYVSREELLAIEQARLRLRGELGLAVDRGRLVRAAMALALADLDSAGTDGELVRRLTAS
jgi:hypothetical protein